MTVAHGTSESAGTHYDEDRGRYFPCEGCGADLEFHIGQQKLACPYCGHTKEIASHDGAQITERDLQQTLVKLASHRGAEEKQQLGNKEIKCDACAATVVFAGTLTSTECSYCGSPLQLKNVHDAQDRIPVDGILPFKVEQRAAQEELKAWVKSRWFAPNEFKRRGAQGAFSGMYFPYWTYDAMTQSAWTGQRGDAYYVTVGSGEKKRRVRRIRWTRVSGAFPRFFDDVLVCAARSIRRTLMRALEPWPLTDATPFTPDVLAGYLAMTYDLPLDEGFELAKSRIDEAINDDIRSRIGGDEQRITSCNTSYGGLTYKHVLLPVWMLAYRFGDKSYQVVVNACTGEVQGERPWSWIKITLAVLAGLAVAGTIAYVVETQ